MEEGQKNNRVGAGMKRRAKRRVSGKKKSTQTKEQPKMECQETIVETAPEAPAAELETGGRINSENEAPENASVAPETQDTDDLEKALKSSGEPTAEDMEAAIEDRTVQTIDLPASGGYDVVIQGDAVQFFNRPDGPQPDGTHKVVVTIQEGYYGAIQEWAESDGISVEEWLSNLLYSSYSTYGDKPQAR